MNPKQVEGVDGSTLLLQYSPAKAHEMQLAQRELVAECLVLWKVVEEAVNQVHYS